MTPYNDGEYRRVMCPHPHDADFTGIRARLQGYGIRDCLSVHACGQTPHTLILIMRREVGEGFTDLWVRKGCGAIEVDKGRIATTAWDQQAMGGANTPGLSGRFKVSVPPIGTFERTSPHDKLDVTKGRWPSNFVLAHGPDCYQSGIRRVRGATGNGDARVGVEGKHIPLRRGNFICRTDDDGMEAIPNMVCQPDCPVHALNMQTGVRTSGANNVVQESKVVNGVGKYGTLSREKGKELISYGDSGYVSRYFKQLRGASELGKYLDFMRIYEGV